MRFFERIAELERQHASYAIATVVARRSPVSAHLGDRALVFADGRMDGFVGGSCSRDIVRRHALGSIRSGTPVLLQIRPDASAGDEGSPANAERVVIPMSCSSEGAVDVYIEPRVPLRRLVVVGFTPVADMLTRLAATLQYDVVRVVAEEELHDLSDIAGARVLGVGQLAEYLRALDASACEQLVAVVASQGHYDELALEILLAVSPAFTGLLASRRRAAVVLQVLAQQGVPHERLQTILSPVGLDIGARSPGEVAVSVLAEVIAKTPVLTRAAASVPAAAGARATAFATDPVCGMDVAPAETRHSFDFGGRRYHFCCAGCRASFAAAPQTYLSELHHA